MSSTITTRTLAPDVTITSAEWPNIYDPRTESDFYRAHDPLGAADPADAVRELETDLWRAVMETV